MEKGDQFKCRICGSTEFREIKTSTGYSASSGEHSTREYCVCNGCSVIFYDSKLFSGKSEE